MASFENLEWTLTAEDKASGTFQKVALSARDLSSASDDVAKSSTSAGKSWLDMAKGVFAGGAALAAAHAAFGLLKSVIVDGIAEAQEYQSVQAQLAAVLTSTGGAAGLVQSDLNAMAEEYAHLAQGGSEAINALQASLLTFTNITSETFKRTTMAALDLATAMNGGVLPTAEELRAQSIQLGKALNDPTKGLTALTRVGVEFTVQQQEQIKTLQEAGQVTEAQTIILDELAKEYGGSASAAAETFHGRMVQLNNAVGDVKKSIGMALLPTLSVLVDNLIDTTGKVAVTDEQMGKWQRGIFEVFGSIRTIIQIIGGFIGVIGALAMVFVKAEQVILAWATDVVRAIVNVGKNASAVFSAMKQAITGDFGGALDTLKGLVADVFKTTIDYGGQLGGAFVDVGSAITDGMQNAKEAVVGFAYERATFDDMAAKMRNTADQAVNTGNAMASGMGEGSDAAGEAKQKIEDSLNKVNEEYEKSRGKIAGELLQLEQSHNESIEKIKDKLSDLNTSLRETTTEYQNTIGEINKTEAERVVEQEQTIADLQDQIAQIRANPSGDEGALSESDNSQIAALESQLAKEKTAYETYIEERKGLDDELTEARRRASLTEFERFVEDINAKRTEEQAAFDARVAEIQMEVTEQQNALALENAVYEAKKAMYAEVDAAFQTFHDSYLANLGEMGSYTSETVAVMASELERITKLFAEIQSIRADAGLAGVSLGSPGESSGSSSSTEDNSVTSQVTINVTGNTLANEQDINTLVSEITRQLELAGVGSQ